MVLAFAGDSTTTRGLATAEQVRQPAARCQQKRRGYPAAVDPKHLLETFGTLGLFAMIFAESGLLIGFFLPGDSLLFTAGLLSSPGGVHRVQFNLALVVVGSFICAVAGAQAGYLIGRRAGPALFRRPESRLFRQEHVTRAEHYFAEHGARTIVLARFVPIVRTFATVVAGVGRMEARTFFAYNLLGGLIWAVGVTLAGYALGRSVPDVDRYLLPIIAVIVVVSFIPAARQLYRARNR